MAALFMLAVSFSRRRRVFEEVQLDRKQALRQTQAQRRRGRAETLRAACRHELAQRATEFGKQRKATVARHAGEIAAQKAEWRQVAVERDKAWTDYRNEFGISDERQPADRLPSIRRDFNGVAPPKPPPTGQSEGDDGRTEGKDDNGVAPKAPTKKSAAGVSDDRQPTANWTAHTGRETAAAKIWVAPAVRDGETDYRAQSLQPCGERSLRKCTRIVYYVNILWCSIWGIL